jgi:hypothetical protein
VPIKRGVEFNAKIGVKTGGTGVELANDKMSINLIATAGFNAGAPIILTLAVQAPAQLYCYVASDNRVQESDLLVPNDTNPMRLSRHWPLLAGFYAKEHGAAGDPGHELRIERPKLDQEIPCHQ